MLINWIGRRSAYLTGFIGLPFSQKKTRKLQYLDITQQAYVLLGEPDKEGKVFKSLVYSAYMNNEMLRWCGASSG